MPSRESMRSEIDTKPTGWEAQLDLTFTARSDKTVLSKREQRGPLAVQRAFYPEGDVCHLYILHPPGGVVGGDKLTINVHVQPGASGLLTTPGATKFYKSQGYFAEQQQNIQLDDGASLEWLPQENIYFPGAQSEMRTKINLTKNTRFIGWETHCLGLPANEEQFSEGQVRLDFAIYSDDRPIILERMEINQGRLTASTGLRGNSVMAMLVATPADEGLLEQARSVLEGHADLLVAATLVENCLLVRYLGNSTAQSKQILTSVWKALRPIILQREVCAPRIWAT